MEYAIRVLKNSPKPKGLKKLGRRKVYQGEVVNVLEQVWEIYGRICSKRLHPFLSEGVAILERNHELSLSPEIKQLLLNMSPATVNRCLRKVLFTHPRHGLTITKPDTFSKNPAPFVPLPQGGRKTWHFGN